MNRTEHLLWVLAEECAEVAQRASKAARFGLDEVQPGQALTNEERLWQEMCDLCAVGEMLISHLFARSRWLESRGCRCEESKGRKVPSVLGRVRHLPPRTCGWRHLTAGFGIQRDARTERAQRPRLMLWAGRATNPTHYETDAYLPGQFGRLRLNDAARPGRNNTVQKYLNFTVFYFLCP